MREISDENFDVFLVSDLETLRGIPAILNAENQFRRIGHGPVGATLLSVIEQPPLVQFFVLESVCGPAYPYPNFNQTV